MAFPNPDAALASPCMRRPALAKHDRMATLGSQYDKSRLGMPTQPSSKYTSLGNVRPHAARPRHTMPTTTDEHNLPQVKPSQTSQASSLARLAHAKPRLIRPWQVSPGEARRSQAMPSIPLVYHATQSCATSMPRAPYGSLGKHCHCVTLPEPALYCPGKAWPGLTWRGLARPV